MCDSTSFSILAEEIPTKVFKAGRGLRQDDPLSPYLFALIMEKLSVTIDEGVRRRKIKLYKVHGM